MPIKLKISCKKWKWLLIVTDELSPPRELKRRHILLESFMVHDFVHLDLYLPEAVLTIGMAYLTSSRED
jgi:hypothetical protein